MTEPLSADQAFIRKLTDIVLDNLHNENFGVGELTRESGLSRYTIHRRLRALKNQNLSQFIREIRLTVAMEMLKQHDGNVTEISYKVGFGSPAYFSRCFHNYYGYPPGEVKRQVVSGGTEEEVPVVTSRGNSFVPRKRLFVISLATLTSLLLLWISFTVLFGSNNLISGLFNNDKELSIVVLPFKNFSDDTGNQYFADGIMEDILNNLYRISDLRVISRTTSERFRESGLTAGEIGRMVNAGNVLEGSVRRYGDQVRISVQLIDASRDQHLWSANFDSDLTDVIAIQSDIALQVASTLKAVISEKELKAIEEAPTANAMAHDYYLKARFLLHKANSEQRFDFSREAVQNCIGYYERAIAEDNNFAEAYAGLANAWFNLSAWGWLPAGEGFIKAWDYCNRALEIDPDCAEAHAVKGVWFAFPGQDFEAGRRELQLSLSLNPNFSTAQQWYAQVMMITGPVSEARKHVDIALELESYFWVTHNLDAWIAYFEERYESALEASLIARDLKPGYIDNQWLFFLNYVKLGDEVKAAAMLQTIAQRYPEAVSFPGEIMQACNEDGIRGLFLWLVDVNMNRPVPVQGMNGHDFYIAWWNAILGNEEATLYRLEKNLGNEMRLGHYFNLIANNPDFDFLRDNPRFIEVIRQAGLSDYHTRPSQPAREL